MTDTLIPCFVCGTTLTSVFDSTNQPSEGTEFSTYGHYGSTVWDSFEGEELVLNICDECLKKHTERLARHKRFRRVVVSEKFDIGTDQEMTIPTTVGREWLKHEMVPYFEGPEDHDHVEIEPEEIGTLTGYNIEWVKDWSDLKERILKGYADE